MYFTTCTENFARKIFDENNKWSAINDVHKKSPILCPFSLSMTISKNPTPYPLPCGRHKCMVPKLTF